MNRIKEFDKKFDGIQSQIEEYSKKVRKKIKVWDYKSFLSIESNLTTYIRELVKLREEIEINSDDNNEQDRNMLIGNITREINSLETRMKLNSHSLLKFSIYFSIIISLISLLIAVISLIITIILS